MSFSRPAVLWASCQLRLTALVHVMARIIWLGSSSNAFHLKATFMQDVFPQWTMTNLFDNNLIWGRKWQLHSVFQTQYRQNLNKKPWQSHRVFFCLLLIITLLFSMSHVIVYFIACAFQRFHSWFQLVYNWLAATWAVCRLRLSISKYTSLSFQIFQLIINNCMNH